MFQEHEKSMHAQLTGMISRKKSNILQFNEELSILLVVDTALIYLKLTIFPPSHKIQVINFLICINLHKIGIFIKGGIDLILISV